MSGHKITCPYCFYEFDDADVHFRMEATDESDPRLEPREDPAYTQFWDQYGGTTEEPEEASDNDVNPWLRRVYALGTPKLLGSRDDCKIQDGIVVSTPDLRAHRDTSRRVCPNCHNPLPGHYGRFPVKFVSVIGITGSGKTVYLSQLCKHLAADLGGYSISANLGSLSAYTYMKENEIVDGETLPQGTPPEQLLQPLTWEVTFTTEDGNHYSQTFVFYDIAGENLQLKLGGDISDDAKRFGPFIKHSDAIIMLVDPVQFDPHADAQDAATALTVVRNLFGADEFRRIPLAVCISKADDRPNGFTTNCQDIIDLPTLPPMASTGEFDANDYNSIRDKVEAFVKSMASKTPLYTNLNAFSDCFNYFMVESIGTDIVQDDRGFLVPDGDPEPKRIVEPLLWLFTELHKEDDDPSPILTVDGTINEPGDWHCKNPDCGYDKPIRKGQKFCPKCGLNRQGKWKCPKCGTLNPRDEPFSDLDRRYCINNDCLSDRFGNTPGFFDKRRLLKERKEHGAR